VPTCQGFGNTIGLDLNLVIPNRELSLSQGAVEPWMKPQYEWAHKELLRLGKQAGIPTTVPFRQLTREQQKTIVQGRNGFDGVLGFFDWLETKKYKLHGSSVPIQVSRLHVVSRLWRLALRLEARLVRVSGKTLPEICSMSAAEAAEFFDHLTLSPSEMEIAGRLLSRVSQSIEIPDRCRSSVFDYLIASLRRCRAEKPNDSARHEPGRSLVGALYVLDEPSIGLHPRDNARLIRILKNLRDIGNTVLVVEHEPEMMLSSDKLIDIGPGAGELGVKWFFKHNRRDDSPRAVAHGQVPARRARNQSAKESPFDWAALARDRAPASTT